MYCWLNNDRTLHKGLEPLAYVNRTHFHILQIKIQKYFLTTELYYLNNHYKIIEISIINFHIIEF